MLQKAQDRLPEKERIANVLRDIEGLSTLKIRSFAIAITVLMIMCILPMFGRSQNGGFQETVAVNEISPNVLVFATSTGNVVASVGPDGALLVGTPAASSTSQIMKILADRTKSNIRYVVIAPEPPDDMQGDAGWNRTGAFVAMHEAALEQLGGHAMGSARPLPKRLGDMGVDRPHISFSDVLSFDMNGDAIHIIHQQPGYSTADAVVHFHVANLIYFGEAFPGDGYPQIERKLGAKIEGWLNTLKPWSDGMARVVPARGPVVTAQDLKAFINMLTTVRDRIQKMIDAGQTEEEIVDKHPTADFDVRFGHGRVTPDAFVRSVYEILKKP